MIPAAAFYREFDAAFAPPAKAAGLARRGRSGAKWRNAELEFNFRVNPKASMLPDCPGEFWPVIEWNGPRHGPRDDGTVSYYQYESQTEPMQAMQHAILDKPAVRACAFLATLRSLAEHPLVAQSPHTGLYYVDEGDARAWGAWFGERVGEWLRRFAAAPETLETWAWRVLWAKK